MNKQLDYIDWKRQNYFTSILNDEVKKTENEAVSQFYDNSFERLLRGFNLPTSILENEKEWDELECIDFKGLDDGDDTRVFIDMDGVLAEFFKGKTMEEVFSKGYFASLPPHWNMIDAVEELSKNYEVFILSKSCHFAVTEKLDWLKEHMPFIDLDHIILVPLEADKARFIPPNKGIDVLIDDYWKNFKDWDGIKIKAQTKINTPNLTYDGVNIDKAVVIDSPEITGLDIANEIREVVEREKEAEEEMEI